MGMGTNHPPATSTALQVYSAAIAATARLDGSWTVEAAGKAGTNKDKTANRDVYMSTAYYNPSYR